MIDDKPTVRTLEDLMQSARGCATLAMKEYGRIIATLFILTEAQSMFLFRGNMEDDHQKDVTAMTSRLLCIAHDAKAVVFLAEGWMSTKSASETGAPHVPPSQDPNRKEVVMLFGEAREKRQHIILPVLRTQSGAFRTFGDGSSSFDSAEGRFTNFIPPVVPTPNIKAEAKALLDALGVTEKLRRWDGVKSQAGRSAGQ